MLKTAAAIASAAIIAGALTGYPDFIGQVSAGPSAGVQVVAAPACPDRGWPYQHCGTGVAGEPAIRLISTDRLN